MLLSLKNLVILKKHMFLILHQVNYPIQMAKSLKVVIHWWTAIIIILIPFRKVVILNLLEQNGTIMRFKEIQMLISKNLLLLKLRDTLSAMLKKHETSLIYQRIRVLLKLIMNQSIICMEENQFLIVHFI